MESQISQPVWRLGLGQDSFELLLLATLVPILFYIFFVIVRLVLKVILPSSLAGPRGTLIDTRNLDGHLDVFSLALWRPSVRRERRAYKKRVYGYDD